MSATRALVVDDNRLNRDMIAAQLGTLGYQTLTASDGQEAWDLLEREGERLDVVLLDRRMPRMDGMEVLARIKASARLQSLPVVMQTAADSEREVVDGIKAGVFYYLTKPFRPEVLLSVTAAAVADHARYRRLQRGVDQQASALRLAREARFTFRTLSEASDLATSLAAACPDPQRQVIGLSELLINAVEHGNLGITYEEKSALLKAGRLDVEVAARLATPEHADKRVEVLYRRAEDRIDLTITDQGAGFDWSRYLEMDAERVFDVHGRGIALARAISFDALDYRGRGNEVVASVRFPPFPTDGGADSGARLDVVAAGAEPPDRARLVQVQDRLINTYADLQAYRSRLDADLAAARRMQHDLLPKAEAVAALEERYGVTLASHFETSSELGGDLFGMHPIDDHRFGLWIVDFAGHGVAAALNTFRLHALLTEFPEWRRHPGEYLSLLGARLAELLPTGQYATAFYGVVDTVADTMRYAAAATPAPLFLDPATGHVARGDGSGLPLGIDRDTVYETREVPLPAGSVLILYSDALTESGWQDGETLGLEGVERSLGTSIARLGHAPDPAGLVVPLVEALRRPLTDDLSILVCRRHARAPD